MAMFGGCCRACSASTVRQPHRQRCGQLWACAEGATPAADVATYTQAIMDFGATLCTRHEPLCMHCPLQSDCVALATGRVQELPARVREPRGVRAR